MDSSFQPQLKWYKTRIGRIFLAIVSTFFVILLSFGALVVYYTWQVVRGNEVVITNPFSSTLSQESLQKSALPVSEADIQKIIRTDNPTRGDKTAPVTIVAFIDFECPFSQASFAPLEEALGQYSEATRVVFKHVPLTTIHPRAVAAATAAQCAYKQNKFWEYYQTLFTVQDLTETGLQEAAKQNNLSLTQWSTCQKNKSTDTSLNQDLKDAATLGVRGTPTFFVNGVRVEGVKTANEWKSIILESL